MTTPAQAEVLVASNRGPVSFTEAGDGSLTLRRGGGGLVSGLQAVSRAGQTLWVCAALSDADRLAARLAPGGRLDLAGHDTGGGPVRMLGIDRTTFHRAYNSLANSTLWFVNHLLFDLANAPSFDAGFRREWAAYTAYDDAFAEALAEEAAPGASVVVQDYHLTLTPGQLRKRRPHLRIGHFSHTPWAPPEYFSLLPDDVARDVLLGVLAVDHAGFLSPRWAAAFVDCCESVLGAAVDRGAGTVELAGHCTRIGVHPLGVDPAALRARAAEPDVQARLEGLRELAGDRQLIVRIDRTELSKNIVRGLAAYRELLRTRPQWHGRVVHVAFAYPSRHDLPEYREYTAAVQRIGKEIEDEFATEDWMPLLLDVSDDYPRSLAAYRLADPPPAVAPSAAEPAASQPVAATGSSWPPTASSAPAPARAPLTVLNNSRRPGLAERAAAQFESGGWTIADIGNFTGRIPVTTVYFEPGQQAAAAALAAQFPVIRRVLPRFAGLPGSGLTVVVTREYPA